MAKQSAWAADDGVRGPRGRGLALLLGSVLALVACSSGTDGAPSTVGGEPNGNPNAGGSSGTPGAEAGQNDDDGNIQQPAGATPGAATMEGLDPNAIGNVPAPDGQGAGEAGSRDVPVPSSGCGQLGSFSSGARTLQVDGVERSYVLDVPAAYAGNQPIPLVFAFHGATTSGALFRSAFYGNLLSSMGDAAIVVHPDALGDPTAWDAAVDIAFFDALLAELGGNLCVDQARVFATGHSSGGFFTNTLGCLRGDVLRAIAPVSGGGPFGAAGCSGEVAVWLAHADNDETVPFDNGVRSRDRWLTVNGCSDASVPAQPAPCVEYTGCSPGLPVRWCVYQDGHDWPDFGPEGIWGFFSSF